jgi:hypothetical protein
MSGRFADGAGIVDVIREGMEDRIRALNTSEPGEVVSYDVDTQTATVRPMVAGSVLDDDNAFVLEYPPDIYDVPVMHLRSRAGYLHMPIITGDTGLLVYPQRDIGQWRSTGQRGSPGDHRACSKSGAVLVLGLMTNERALDGMSSEDLILGVLGAALLLLGGPSATDYVALSSKVEAELTKIKTAISGAAVLANDDGATFKTNIIAALNSSGMGASGSTAATKVKAL